MNFRAGTVLTETWEDGLLLKGLHMNVQLVCLTSFFRLYIFCTNGTCKYDHIDRESEIDLPPLFLEKATLIFALNIYDTHTQGITMRKALSQNL